MRYFLKLLLHILLVRDWSFLTLHEGGGRVVRGLKNIQKNPEGGWKFFKRILRGGGEKNAIFFKNDHLKKTNPLDYVGTT